MMIEKTLLTIWIILGLAILATFCIPALAFAQVSVTFSPQGPEVLTDLLGRRAPSLSFISVDVCNSSSSNLTLSSSRVYQSAVTAGHQPISPYAIDSVIAQELKANWRSIAANIIGIGADIGAVVTASGAVKADSKYTVGFVLGGVVFRTIATALRKRLPDTSAWRGKILDGILSLPARHPESDTGCENRLMLARYKPNVQGHVQGQVTVPLTADIAHDPTSQKPNVSFTSPAIRTVQPPSIADPSADYVSPAVMIEIPSRPAMRR